MRRYGKGSASPARVGIVAVGIGVVPAHLSSPNSICSQKISLGIRQPLLARGARGYNPLTTSPRTTTLQKNTRFADGNRSTKGKETRGSGSREKENGSPMLTLTRIQGEGKWVEDEMPRMADHLRSGAEELVRLLSRSSTQISCRL